MTTNHLVKSANPQLWYAAIKPPMYTVAIIPITVGTAVAFQQTQQINWGVYSLFLSAAIAIIAWLNLSNDFFDSYTGIDQNKPHSVVNLTGSRTLVFWVSNLCLVLGLGGIFAIAWGQQDWTLLLIILLACALGYSYQGPPFRLGYQGLGEIICFITFGPMAIAAAYYSQVQTLTLNSLPAACLIGLSTSIILFCSHFHQVQDDLAAGKRSPIVRMGTDNGVKVLTASTVCFYLLTLLFVLLGDFSPWTLLVFLSLPLAYELVHHVGQYHNQPDKVKNCKFIAVKLHFWTGLLLSLGLVVPHFG
ncbi:2-carboxy-1,4-naphthoquinone phytyltransferase [Spirulina sp. CS-785/01]|uniref:2-carboxy-1,4-naphthoquinone phytyltransferase n=1 Tax=Spirulina sp. CS-785/01 TaxID=3021716 RepID=UPI00232D8ABB|nr:2-carboxy-1,4-naphthoquinone phytyltransferase [Spirulina sp. CS-785/01]MDB9314869.1 2-carboxy-1,4-naphthoquinone phytyltransferase [Spirulina sp. CS-785/01]